MTGKEASRPDDGENAVEGSHGACPDRDRTTHSS